MVTDTQERNLMKLTQTESTLAAAAKAGMDEKTARKYRTGRLPSQRRVKHTWRTRPDPFADVWHEVEEKLKNIAGLEAKTLF